MKAVLENKGRAITLDFVTQARPDFIPVNRLVHDALELSMRSQPEGGEKLEIFHCAGGRHVALGELITTAGNVCEVNVSFGVAKNALDQEIANSIALKVPFANTEWIFERTRLDKAIGGNSLAPIDLDTIQRLFAWYWDTSADHVSSTRPMETLRSDT